MNNLPALIAEFEREHEIYGWQSVDGIEYYRRRKRVVDYQECTRWLIKRLK